MYESAILDHITRVIIEEFPKVTTRISPSGVLVWYVTDKYVDTESSPMAIKAPESDTQCRTVFIDIIDNCYHIYIDWINNTPSAEFYDDNGRTSRIAYPNLTEYIDGSLLNPDSVSDILKILRHLLLS